MDRSETNPDHNEIGSFFNQIAASRSHAATNAYMALEAHAMLDACNVTLAQQNLHLTPASIAELQESRAEALGATGQIEVGAGILPQLSEAFASSPYLQQENLAQTLATLQEAFYELRRQADLTVSDDDLLDAMRTTFDEEAAGCADILLDMDVEALLAGIENDGEYLMDDDGQKGLETPETDVESEHENEHQPGRITALPLPWNEDRWMDSFESDGWDGEKWAADHDR